MDVIERKAERNAAIFAAWLDGKSFADIGREHDITRQRAGQLVRIEAQRQLQGAVEALQRIALNPRGGEQRNIAREALYKLGVWKADPSSIGGQ
jgi:hypothetical protein